MPLPDPRLAKLAEMFDSDKIVPAPVTFVDIAGHRQGCLRRRRPGQQVPGQHPRVRRDLPGGAGVHRRRRRARRRQGRSEVRHRGDRDRADPRRPADARAGGAAAGEGGANPQGPAARSRGRAWRRRRCSTGARRCSRPVRRRDRVAARAEPDDHQAVPLCVQRRRGGADRRGAGGGAARAGRAGRCGVPGREDRGGAAGARRRVGRRAAGVDRPDRAWAGCVGAGGFSHAEVCRPS